MPSMDRLRVGDVVRTDEGDLVRIIRPPTPTTKDRCQIEFVVEEGAWFGFRTGELGKADVRKAMRVELAEVQ